MKRSELISDIREILRDHNIDSEIADRHIMFLVRTKRHKFLRQREINDRGDYRTQFQQTLFMNLEIVDDTRMPTVIPGNKIVRTIKPIPNIIGREIFKHLDVRTINYLGEEIEVLDKHRMSNVKYAPKGFIYCYREDDGRLYFWAHTPGYMVMEQVVVQCILEDPEDIVDINELTEPLEEYPLTGDVWEIIRPEVIKDLLGSKSIPIDVINDKADYVAQPQK